MENDESLRFNKGIMNQRTMFGVPSNLMIVSIIIVLGAFFTIGWLAGLLLFLLIIPPLITIHKDDDQALYFMIDKFMRPDTYRASFLINREFKLLVREKHKFKAVKFNQTNREMNK